MNNIIEHYNITPKSSVGNKALYTNIVNRGNFTLPNSLDKLQQTRYFSGVDAEIWFGDIYVDETININFTLQQNSMPIFGYNSFVFDVCAQGSRYISGSFTINFTKSNYLYEILSVLSAVTSGSSLPSVENNDKLIKSTKSAMWNKCFDIVLSYGNYKTLVGQKEVDLATMVALRGVYIIGCSQNFGTSTEEGKNQSIGQIPISETYFFYARDIDYEPSVSGSYDTESDVTRADIDFCNFDLSYSPSNSGYELFGHLRYDDSRIEINSININIDNMYSYSKSIYNKEYDDTTHSINIFFSDSSAEQMKRTIINHWGSLLDTADPVTNIRFMVTYLIEQNGKQSLKSATYEMIDKTIPERTV